MGESDGTNLEPIPQIVFFKQAYKNQQVPVLQLDSRHERQQSTSTLRRENMLTTQSIPLSINFTTLLLSYLLKFHVCQQK